MKPTTSQTTSNQFIHAEKTSQPKYNVPNCTNTLSLPSHFNGKWSAGVSFSVWVRGFLSSISYSEIIPCAQWPTSKSQWRGKSIGVCWFKKHWCEKLGPYRTTALDQCNNKQCIPLVQIHSLSAQDVTRTNSFRTCKTTSCISKKQLAVAKIYIPTEIDFEYIEQVRELTSTDM